MMMLQQLILPQLILPQLMLPQLMMKMMIVIMIIHTLLTINYYWERKHWTLTVLQEVGQSWHVIWIRKTTSTNAKSCSRLRRWENKILLFKMKLLISQKTMTLRLVLLTSFFNLATSVSVLLFCNWQLYVYLSIT